MTGRGRSLAILTLVVLIGGCGSGPTEDPGPPIAVDAGLAPIMTPDRVAAIVLGHIRSDEALIGRALAPPRILRMTVTTSDRVNRVEPNAGNGPQQPGGPFIVWVIRAQGTFATRRGRGPEPISASTGFYVIADADASVISFGFP